MSEPLPATLAAAVATAGSAATRDPGDQLGPATLGGLHARNSHPALTPAVIAARAVSWATDRWRAAVLLLALAAATVLLVGHSIALHPGSSAQARSYVADAWAVISHGQLAAHGYGYQHPPLGWIQLGILIWTLGLAVKGAAAISAARWLVLVPAVATVALVYVVARRLGLRQGGAALAAVLLIASPLGVESLRQLELANFALPWTLAAFALVLSPRRRLWAYAAGGACMALAALSSESALLLAPGLIVAAYQNADARTRAFCLTGLGVGLALTAAIFPLYALLKGQLLPAAGHPSLLSATGNQLFNRVSTGSVFAAHSQSRSTIGAWAAIDPWLLGAGALCVIPALAIRRLRPAALALGLAALVPVGSNHLSPSFDVWLLPLCALLTAGIIDATVTRLPRSTR